MELVPRAMTLGVLGTHQPLAPPRAMGTPRKPQWDTGTLPGCGLSSWGMGAWAAPHSSSLPARLPHSSAGVFSTPHTQQPSLAPLPPTWLLPQAPWYQKDGRRFCRDDLY